MNKTAKLELAIKSLKRIADHSVRQSSTHVGMVDVCDVDDLKRIARLTLESMGEDDG